MDEQIFHQLFFSSIIISSILKTVGIKTTEIIGPSTSVREGDIAVIECVAYGSKPAADIIWRNG